MSGLIYTILMFHTLHRLSCHCTPYCTFFQPTKMSCSSLALPTPTSYCTILHLPLPSPPCAAPPPPPHALCYTILHPPLSRLYPPHLMMHPPTPRCTTLHSFFTLPILCCTLSSPSPPCAAPSLHPPHPVLHPFFALPTLRACCP